jgi:predicted transposase YbfD/YdcC
VSDGAFAGAMTAELEAVDRSRQRSQHTRQQDDRRATGRKREDGGSPVAFSTGVGRLHRDHRRHGYKPSIAQAIRERGADYVLAVKDNQPHLCDALREFFTLFQDASEKTPHTFHETLEKNHGRIEHRRC